MRDDTLIAVIDIIHDEHKRLVAELDATPTGWFGRLKRRHYEIMAESDALIKVTRQLKGIAFLRAKEERE